MHTIQAEIEQHSTLSMKKMANQQNVNPNTIKSRSKHWFGPEIICQDPKAPAHWDFEIKKNDKMQKVLQ